MLLIKNNLNKKFWPKNHFYTVGDRIGKVVASHAGGCKWRINNPTIGLK